MLIIPAIDLKDGRCVRLEQGHMDYGDRVLRGARRRPPRNGPSKGARRLHVVDLNGAVAGKPRNEAAVKAIIAAVDSDIPVQLGGGIRDLDTIERYLDDGVSYVIIGTAAVKNPGFLHEACDAFPGHIIVGLDAKDGKVATDGWSKLTGHDVLDLAKRFQDYGVEAVIYTDIGRDGMMTGVNIEATVRLAQALTVPVIASGGLNSLDDVGGCARSRPRASPAAIAGRAIYEGKLDFAAAHEASPTARPEWRLAKRIIPCLDVHAGRVVKGVNFVAAARRRRPGRDRARATTRPAPTSSPSSTSPPPATRATPSST